MKTEIYYIRLGKVIRHLRKKAGWIQQDLADLSNLSRGSIANIETGRQRLMLHDIVMFAAIFNISPKTLFGKIL